MNNAMIQPFRVQVSDDILEDLKRRLRDTRWPDAETVDDWSQGVPLAYMQDVCSYWQNKYDWRKAESRINALPNFRTEIDGLGIHFLHIRSKHENALPLIMTHGWPGSILEFMKVIDPLVNPTAHGGNAEDAFHVVCPSIPGYGFSDKPTQKGWGIEKVAEAWATLMARLGYSRYVAQGGDWGAGITTYIGNQDPSHCAAIHLNFPVVLPDPETMSNLTPKEMAALAAFQYYQDVLAGYSKQQATRPQSLGYALAGSPIGQAAWILEKFCEWSDCNGNPESVFTRDELLDDVMMYWVTNAGASSARLYWESFGKYQQIAILPLTIPVGCSIFPKEIFRCSERWAKKRFENLVYWNELEKGGHFAALEQPELFVQELRACFRLTR